jgi:hypothetical protein
MDKNYSPLKEAEDGIKKRAKAVENFAAPEESVARVRAEDLRPPYPPAGTVGTK